jgi:hypothetical protein
MSIPSILLIAVSLTVLLLGFQSWRLTGSRAVMLNTLVGSMGLLLSAYAAGFQERNRMACIIPFFVSMLLAGWGLGTLWKSRSDTALRLPSTLMLIAATVSISAAFVVYLQ